jgi:hypothetical protein
MPESAGYVPLRGTRPSSSGEKARDLPDALELTMSPTLAAREVID